MTAGVIDSIRDGILTFDHTGQITLFNPEAESIFELNASTLVGQTYAEAFLLIDGLEAFSDAVIDMIQSHEKNLNKNLTVTINGKVKHLSFRASLLRDSNDQSNIGVIIAVTDITENIIALQKIAQREQERSAMGRFIVAMSIIFSIFTLLLEPIQRAAKTYLFDVGPFLALGTLLVIAFFISRWKDTSLSSYGINWRFSRRDLKDTLLWSLGLCAFMTLAKYIVLIQSDNPTDEANALFSFYALDDGSQVTNIGLLALGLSIYLVSIVIQEIATRSAIQAPLARFLDGVVRFPQWLANITSTLMFAVLHAHLNPVVSITVIIPSLLWGWLFMRSGGVIAPIISHTIVGVYAIFILGLFAGMDQV